MRNNFLKIFQIIIYDELSTQGSLLSSKELSEKINMLGVTGKSDLTILINAEQLQGNEILTVSLMDMVTDIKTLVLFEQIYCSYRILNNEPYHK